MGKRGTADRERGKQWGLTLHEARRIRMSGRSEEAMALMASLVRGRIKGLPKSKAVARIGLDFISNHVCEEARAWNFWRGYCELCGRFMPATAHVRKA